MIDIWKNFWNWVHIANTASRLANSGRYIEAREMIAKYY